MARRGLKEVELIQSYSQWLIGLAITSTQASVSNRLSITQHGVNLVVPRTIGR